jgi:hypothetical protein
MKMDSDRDIIMREREPEPPITEPYWVVQFADSSFWKVAGDVPTREVIASGKAQHKAFGKPPCMVEYAIHIPSGAMIKAEV